MQLLHSRNSWTYSFGFNMAVDFCVWVLEIDGLHVPPFDHHTGGDGSLQASGLNTEQWQSWFARVINAQETQRQRFQQRAKEDPQHSQKDLSKWLIAEAHLPAAAWQGDATVGNQLTTLWNQYGPLSNERRSWERDLSRQLHKAEAGARKRLYDELLPYSNGIPSLTIHFINYPQPLDYLLPPSTIIMTIQHGQPDAAEFRERVLAAAGELAAMRSGKRRSQSKFITAAAILPGQTLTAYTILTRKPVMPAPAREKVQPVAENATKQVVLDWLNDERHRSHFDEVNMATVRFEREKAIPGWQLYFVSFAGINGDQYRQTFVLRQRADDSWMVCSASSSSNIEELVSQFLVPIRDHPLIFLSGGKAGHANNQFQFIAHGEVIDNGFNVARVRLLNNAGQVFEDAVEDGLVFFATMQDQEVQWPMQAELYDNSGKLVWRQTVFDDRPPPWLRFKRR
ncbi:MAG TPA: hypothetical protein VFA09_08895 [Ktedonobacteraceae bacterium]|nr:hypothetical protein [Ktedonobacteraceae bacterium]